MDINIIGYMITALCRWGLSFLNMQVPTNYFEPEHTVSSMYFRERMNSICASGPHKAVNIPF